MSIKSKIKALETEMALDREKILFEKFLLVERIRKIKNTYFAYQLIIPSFLFGYFMIAMNKKAWKHKKIGTLGIFLLKTLRWVKRYALIPAKLMV